MKSSPLSASRLPSPPETTPSNSAQEAARDAALVARFNSGDETAFVEIMRRHHAKLFNLAHNLLHNTADAEEIVQDAFIRAHRGLANFRGDSSLSTWLYRVTINLARNRYWYFFRRRRQDSLSLDHALASDSTATFADMIAAPDDGPVHDATLNEFTRLLAVCMEKIDARHREILTMRNVLDLSYEDMAQSLGINIGTVKSRLARARESLRKLLAEQAPELDAEAGPSAFFGSLRHAQGLCAVA